MKILAVTLSLAAVFICYAAASPNGLPDSGAGCSSVLLVVVQIKCYCV